MSTTSDLLSAAKEIDRLLLVIESAVRNADPKQWPAVVRALKANHEAIKATLTPQQQEVE